MLSMQGNENKFHVPGLCSVVPSLNSGSLNLANSLMGLLLLPLKTFDTSSTENRPRSVKRNQGGRVFLEEVFFLEIFFSSDLHFVIALLRPFFKNRPMS